MSKTFDLFLSYRWADAASVRPVLDALAARGVSVWHDAREVEDFASIQSAVSSGLASSRALLAWYSLRYNDSRACQWELTSAYAAAQADSASSGDPRQRILVVNPETSNTHVLLPELFDQLHLSAQGVPDDAAAVDRLADRVVQALAEVPASPLGALRALTPPRWLPSMGTGSNRFVGRLREMWRLHGTLQAGHAAMLTGTGGKAGLALVRGAGGIGKSLMAEEYALRFGAAYPGGVFWLRAYGYADGGTEMTPQQRSQSREAQCIDFAQGLGIDTQGKTAVEIRAALVNHLGAQGQPFLWVVDDLPADPGPEGVAGWQAPHPLGSTLFTSRTRRFEHLATLELPQLEPADARALLTRHRVLSAAEVGLADAICALLGYHALAVDVTAALVKRRGLEGVLTALQHPGRDALELAAQLDEALPNGHQRAIAATFLASIEQLGEAAKELLCDAAVLTVAPIPMQLLVGCRAAAQGGEDDEVRDAVDLGIDQALTVSLMDEAGEGLVSVHALVSRTLRFARPDPQAWAKRKGRAVALLTREMTKAVDIRVHGQLVGWVEQARALSEAPEDELTADLRGWVARYDRERGAYALARQGYEQQLDARRRVLGEEHPDTLTSMSDLAHTLSDQGDLAGARILYEQDLAISRRVLGEEHPDTLTSIHNLASTLWAQGDLSGARTLEEQVLVVRRNVLGEEHPDTLISMGNLAVTLREQGDLSGARTLEEQVLSVSRRVLGEDHPDTLTSMSNLALTLGSQGDLSGAHSLLEQSLAVRRNVLGEEHPGTLMSMNNLAHMLWAKGDLAGARSLQEQVLAVRRRVLGEEHPDTLASMNNLARTLEAQGELEEGILLMTRVIHGLTAVLGPDHPHCRKSADSLARMKRARA